MAPGDRGHRRGLSETAQTTFRQSPHRFIKFPTEPGVYVLVCPSRVGPLQDRAEGVDRAGAGRPERRPGHPRPSGGADSGRDRPRSGGDLGKAGRRNPFLGGDVAVAAFPARAPAPGPGLCVSSRPGRARPFPFGRGALARQALGPDAAAFRAAHMCDTVTDMPDDGAFSEREGLLVRLRIRATPWTARSVAAW